MSKFAQRVDVAVEALSSNSPKEVDENDFIDASRLVYDGVREIRRAVLMNRVSKRFCAFADFFPPIFSSNQNKNPNKIVVSCAAG